MGIELAQAQLAAPGQYVGRWHHGDDFFGEKFFAIELLSRRRQETDADIELTRFQTGFDIFHGQFGSGDANARMRGAEAPDDFRDDAGVHSLNDADLQFAALQSVKVHEREASIFEFAHDATGVGKEQLAGGSEFDPAANAVEQREIQLPLELANLMRQGWLRDVEFRRGFGEMLRLGNSQKVTEMAEFNRREIHRCKTKISSP